MTMDRTGGVPSICVLAAAAALSGALLVPAIASAKSVEASVERQAGAYKAPKAPGGWVLYDVYDVPTGTTTLFLHATCPGTTKNTAYSGGILPNNTAHAGLQFLGSGPRIDEEPPDYTSWFWLMAWPSGSPSGAQLTPAVYCGK